MIDIKTTSNTPRFSTPINEGSKRKFLLMKEDYITLKFSLKEPIYFKLGDYVDDSRFGLFELCDLQKPTYNENTAGYDYELRLDAYYWKWKNKKFKFTPETGGQEASWNLTASLDVQMGVFLRNLQALGYKYKGIDFDFSIDSTVENSSKLMSYENMNLLDALTKMAEAWDCEWWVADSIIHFGRCEHSDPVDFELGNNVERMTRSDSRTNFATRVYAFGSTKNIPTNYRPIDESAAVNGIVQKRLMLPAGTPCIDAYPNMSTEEAVEDVVVFDDVFPRRTGSMSDVSTKEYTDKIENEDGTTTEKKWLAYRFKDTGITFSKECILAGQELKITFQSGTLNGMEFAVTFNPDKKPEKNENNTWNPDAQVWEIVRNEDYGRELPGDVLIPKNGDTYILSGFDTKFVADTMIPDAEQELKEKAEKYIEKSKIDPSTYDCAMTFGSVKSANGSLRLFEIGDRVNLINAAFFETGSRVSRIIGFEYNLDMPYDSPVYTVGETASYSRISDLEDKIESLTYKGQTYVGNGGSGVYLIRTNDSTPATDSNAFSAKRALNQFLRKDQEDTAQELITFLKGLLIGENGSGITVLPDGKSQAVVDYLYVKVKAIFDELEVKKKTYVGGEQILTPAGMKCIRVEEQEAAYRCYFKAEEDGVEIENTFTVGQLAISQENNIKVGVSHHVGNRYYWRLVTAVGTDYIDLSKTKCDPNIENDIPAAGDDIVALGHSTDITRQGAIVLSSVNEVAPSILMYQGINDFSLAGKDVIGFDYDKATGKARMRVYGDAYIGAKDKSEYIEYKDGKVNIKGTMHIEPGSTGFENVDGLEFGKVNLLRNSGFTGDYNSAKLEEGTELEEETDLYSQALKFWAATNTTVNSDPFSHSGRSVTLSTGILVQTLYYKMIAGEKYIISFKAKGTSVSVSCAGLEKTEQLTSGYQKYIYKFEATAETEFTISGTCTICELQLERGTVPSEWSLSPLDNNSLSAKFEALKYLTDVIREGSTSFIGGLGLLSMILVGNYADGEMKQVTGGLSGVYNDGDDPLLWGDGDLEKAIRTVMACKDNPMAFIGMSEEELANYAKIVLTHGGRAILNDVILRGYVYALGGEFRGKVTQGNGRNVMHEDGSVSFAGGKIRWGADGNPVIEGKFTTSFNGTRIEIDPESNSIRMYNQDSKEIGSIAFYMEEWNGKTNYFPKINLSRYLDDELISNTIIGSDYIDMLSHATRGSATVWTCNLNPLVGLLFSKNGVVTKLYPAE